MYSVHAGGAQLCVRGSSGGSGHCEKGRHERVWLAGPRHVYADALPHRVQPGQLPPTDAVL